MQTLKEIKKEALEKAKDLDNQQLINFLLEKVDTESSQFNTLILFSSRSAFINKQINNKLVPIEKCIVLQNRLRLSLLNFIEYLDNSQNYKNTSISYEYDEYISVNKTTLNAILLFQILILLGIGYLKYSSI